MNVSQKAFRIVNYVAFILSVACLVLLIFPMIGLHIRIDTDFLPIAAGFTLVILIVEFVGIPHRNNLTHYWLAGLFTFALLMVGIIGATTIIIFIYRCFDEIYYILKLLFMFGIYVFIPALLIGIIGASVLRLTSKKIEQAGDGDAEETV